MRVMFSVVSLLVVLAIVGLLASRQLKAVNGAVGGALPVTTSSTAQPAATNVREQSQQLQQRVTTDITKALEQGAARNDSSDKCRRAAQPPHPARKRRAGRRLRPGAARLLRRAARAVPPAARRLQRRRRAHPHRRGGRGRPAAPMTRLTLFTPAGVLARATPLRRA